MTNLSIRPLKEEDISYIVNYWFENNDADLLRMGVDKNKLNSRAELIQTLKNICDTSLDNVKCYYMIWLINGKPIGYNALKDIMKDNIANMHLHMWDSAYRGKGYGAKLFCMSALEFYRLFNLKIILCEPRASNSMPNKMLEKIGFTKWKTYLSTSSELAMNCELNSYIIDINIAADFLKTDLVFIGE